MAEDKIDSIIDFQSIDKEITRLNKNLTDIAATIKGIPQVVVKVQGAGTTKELSLAQNKLAQELKAVESLVNQRFATDAKVITLQTDYAKATAANRVEIQKQNAELKTQAQLQAANTGSIEKAQAAVKALTAERNKLNLYTEEGQKRQAELNSQIDKYNNFIKKNVDALAAQKINVGNYSGAISVLKTSLTEIAKKLDDYNKSGKGNKDVIAALEKEYTILNQLVNSQASGFASAAAEVKENQKALLQMEQAGLRGTKAFNELAIATGQLKDDIGDLKARTKALGSDTFVFDSLIQGAQTLAGAYGVAQGAAALFGAENEDLQKTFVKLQAIMTVIQGLQSVANGLQKESAFILGLQAAKEKVLLGIQSLRNFVLKGTVVATVEAAAATAANTTATNATTTSTVAATAATKAFRIALLATGIGAILVLIVSAANAMGNYSKETGIAAAKTEDLDKALEKNAQSFEDVTDAINKNVERKKILNRINIANDDIRKQVDDQTDLNAAFAIRDAKDVERAANLKLLNIEEAKKSKYIKEAINAVGGTPSKTFLDALYNSDEIKKYNENLIKLADTQRKLNKESATLSESAGNVAYNILAEKEELKRKKAEEDAKKSVEDTKKRNEEAAKKAAADAKASAKAQFDILKDNATERARLLQKFADDEQNNIEDRLDAEVNLYKEKQSIIKAQRDYDLKGEKLTADQKKAINNKYAIDSKILEDSRLKEREALLKSYDEKATAALKAKNDAELNLLIDAREKKKAEIEAAYTQEVQALNSRNLSEKDYTTERAKIDEKYRIEALKAEITYTKAVLDIMKLRGVDVSKELQDLAKLERELSDGTVKKITDNEKTKQEKQLETIKKVEDTYNKIASVISSAIEASTTAQKNKIQDEIDGIENRKQKEIEAVNASTDSQADKANKIAIIEARAAAQKEQQERKQRILDQQKARFDKALSIGRITLSTAEAVMSALAMKPPNVPLAIFNGVLGAAQLAIAIATPIPKFKHGLHEDYEGLGIVGDGGKSEAIVRKDGSIEITPATDTLTHFRKGDRVLPDASVLMQSMQYGAMAKVSQPTQADYTKEMTAALTRELQGVKSAINNKRELHIKPGFNSVMAMHKYGEWFTNYVNEQTNF